ncbi:carbonic anhydrase 1-like [Bicyclus anynana]|uniref:Carbonic anhydrase n=1 Tax=Bicyclus anynana TaxID=110368 RepID=A0ABM3LLL5_BICAN|nr:carbonic anhydrase 1-like [Bicyclus anynana]
MAATDVIAEAREYEKTWPGELCKGGGKRQSPIDIQTNDVVKDFEKLFIKNGSLKFIGYNRVLMTGVNNGHTIQLSTDGNEDMHPRVSGGPLKHSYRLEQLHFHWLSEHSINGIKYPMEIHFVHIRTDLKVAEALRRKDGLAIVAVFCNVQAELTDEQRESTEELMQYIPRLMSVGDSFSGLLLDLNKLLSPEKESYYTYLGSLTSPQCNEAVVWIILDKPIYITDAQYRLFGKVGIGRHNFRSLQPSRQRQVFVPPDSFLTTPRIIVVVVDTFNVVREFFRNVTRYIADSFS